MQSYALLMRALVPLTAALALGLCSPAIAQTSASSLAERLKSIDAKKATEADCAVQLAHAATSNGPQLIYGGTICDAVGKAVESSFLLSAGQLRAMIDVLLMPPATQADDQSLIPLYGMLYYGGGVGGVKDEVLREPRERRRFLKLLDEWAPAYSPAYDPGWNARKRPDPAKYRATVAEAKADIRKHLARAIYLLSDDQYYSLNRQFRQLLERNPKGVGAETPEGKLADDLQKAHAGKDDRPGSRSRAAPTGPDRRRSSGRDATGFPASLSAKGRNLFYPTAPIQQSSGARTSQSGLPSVREARSCAC